MFDNMIPAHSAEVEMWLYLDNDPLRLKLKRITPTSAVLWESSGVASGPATLLVCVDGKQFRRRVNISVGSKDRLVVRIEPLDGLFPS